MTLLSTISAIAISAAKLTHKDRSPLYNQAGYWVQKDKVFFYGGYPNRCMHQVTGADPRTFKHLNNESTQSLSGSFYGKDKSHVYYRGMTVKGADPASFQILGGGFSRDRYAVYWTNEYISDQPQWFTKLGSGLGKDLSHVYGQARIISDDPANFKLVSQQGCFRHYQDSCHVYINDLRLEAADVSTFKLIGFGYGRDKWGVYYFNSAKPRIIPGADPGSFQIINQYYGFDGRHVYRQGSLFTEFDPTTLASLVNRESNGASAVTADALDNFNYLMMGIW